MKPWQFLICLFVLVGISCHTPQPLAIQSKKQYLVNADTLPAVDSIAYRMILPYKERLDSAVHVVVGSTDETLLREKPEGTLGNMVADAVYTYAKLKDTSVNLVVLNYGGVRIGSIAKGNINVGKIFELMPFDNEIVVLKLKGTDIKKLFELVGLNEGWPISGARVVYNKKEIVEIVIGNQPLREDGIYYLATSDYLANGGDNESCLKTALQRTSFNVKIRDAITQYIQTHSPLHMQKEGRVVFQPN